MLPSYYEQLDDLYAAKTGDEIWWPDYCPLPISATYTLLINQDGETAVTAAVGAARLTAC